MHSVVVVPETGTAAVTVPKAPTYLEYVDDAFAMAFASASASAFAVTPTPAFAVAVAPEPSCFTAPCSTPQAEPTGAIIVKRDAL